MGAAWPPLLRLALALDLALLAALALDFLRTPAPWRLDVRRRVPERVGLDQPFARVARVAAGAAGRRAAGRAVELREEFPAAFEIVRPADEAGADGPRGDDPTGGPEGGVVPAEGGLRLVRRYRSARRGVHALGDLRLRLTSPWGLLQRQSRLRATQALRVEPPLLGLGRTLKLAASERWRDLGVRKLRRRGGMTEFESLREYVVGDDPRLVDWKASAKRGTPHVRQYQEERGQELVLVFDCGRRMGATTAEGRVRGWSKLDHALDAGLQLAAVALRQGDRVGALAFDSRVRRWVPPAKGAAQLERLRDAVFAAEASGRESDLGRALRELARRHRRRALLVILSDVADPLSVERQARELGAASRRHKVVFAGLDDPSVRAVAAAPSQAGPDGEPAGGRPDAALLRAGALSQLAERRAGLRKLVPRGWRVLDTLPAETAAPILAAWLDARRSGVF